MKLPSRSILFWFPASVVGVLALSAVALVIFRASAPAQQVPPHIVQDRAIRPQEDEDAAVIVYSHGRTFAVHDPHTSELIRNSAENLLMTADDPVLDAVFPDTIEIAKNGLAVEVIYPRPRAFATPLGETKISQILLKLPTNITVIYLAFPPSKYYTSPRWNHDTEAVDSLKDLISEQVLLSS